MLISPLHICQYAWKNCRLLGHFRRGVHYATTAAYPYVTQLMVYLLIPFQEAIFINFCGNWTLATIQNTKKKKKMKKRDGYPCFFQFYHMYQINYLNEKTKWRQIQMHFHFYLPVTTTAFRIYGAQSMHT